MGANAVSRRPSVLAIVAICTYARPEGLSILLRSLRESSTRYSVSVCVVDNDSVQSALPVVTSPEFDGWAELEYHFAFPRGVSVARNFALEIGQARGASVIFIDDDEIAGPCWLDSLLSVSQKFPDSVIAGPVRPVLLSGARGWSDGGWPWLRPERPDLGVVEGMVGDGNVLLPRSFAAAGFRYDLRFNLSGGQDTHLFRAWVKGGGTIIWSARAWVHEFVPPPRMTLKYVLARGFHAAHAMVRVEFAEKAKVRQVVRRVVGRVLRGVGFCFVAVFTISSARFARGLLDLSVAFGSLAGAIGFRSDRYTGYEVDLDSR